MANLVQNKQNTKNTQNTENTQNTKNTQNADEEKTRQALLGTTSRLVALLPGVHTAIAYLRIHLAAIGTEKEVQLRKEQLLNSLQRIQAFTEGKLQQILVAQHAHHVVHPSWPAIVSLIGGEIHHFQQLREKLEQYVRTPSSKEIMTEIEHHLHEVKRLQEEELFQLQKMNSSGSF